MAALATLGQSDAAARNTSNSKRKRKESGGKQRPDGNGGANNHRHRPPNNAGDDDNVADTAEYPEAPPDPEEGEASTEPAETGDNPTDRVDAQRKKRSGGKNRGG
jgi:hypothetical protein